jgi:signal transduction histidine kinase
VISEFDLSELIKTIVSNFGDSEIEIQKYGPTPLVIKSAASSVQTALNNALKNAIEASKTLPMHSRQPILVTWGVTDLDYWFAVADRGPGLPDGKIENLFKLGQSTKPGHPGAGLEISALSAQALNGKISLSNREGGGATFICRWEKKNR